MRLRAVCPQCNDKGYRILYIEKQLTKNFDTPVGKMHIGEGKPYLQFCLCEKGAEMEELHKQGEIWIDTDTQEIEGLFTRLMKKHKH